MVGRTISHYRILDELGRGGMGVVYRAMDERLERTVAIKVLHSSTIASEAERARFDREAKAAARLSHPHIASVHEIDEAVVSGSTGDIRVPFIVMEFIEGEPLDVRVERGPLPIEEAVQLTVQIASALEAAHEHHIVHRDIKPQNVMLDASGEAKILDFGLVQTDASTKLTQEGSTLGTVAYMSPEQARGELVDRRTDLWSLGVTLYEMVTGQHPFPGDYEQARVYSLLNVDPTPLTSLRTGVPLELERIVNKLMAKDRKLRHQTAADLLADLKALQLGGSGVSRPVVPMAPAQETAAMPERARGNGRSSMPLLLSALVLACVTAVAGYWVGVDRETPGMPIIRSTLDVMDGPEPPVALSVSPSSAFLAYSDLNKVHVRELATGSTWEYASSGEVLRLWFSEDEQWLIMERPGAILRAPTRGGSVSQLVSVEASYTFGLLAPDNHLIYESGGRILKYPLGGGEAVPAIKMDSTTFYNDPALTPNGRYLFVDAGGTRTLFDRESGEPVFAVGENRSFPTFLRDDLLLFGNDDGVYLQPMDLETGQYTDAPFILSTSTHPRAISLSKDGHLFYANQVLDFEGGFSEQTFRRISWDGRETVLPPEGGLYGDFDVDPSGRIAAVGNLRDGAGIMIANLRNGVSNDLFVGSRAIDPILIAGADSVLVIKNSEEGHAELVMAASDGSGSQRTVTRFRNREARHPSLHPDGRRVVLEVSNGSGTETDIWEVDLQTGEQRSLQGGSGSQTHPVVSGDGRWLAFARVEERKPSEIAVQRTDTANDAPPLVIGPGQLPRWDSSGSMLYYLHDGRIYRVDLSRVATTGVIPEPILVINPVGRINSYEILPDNEGVVVTYFIVPVVMPDREMDGKIHVIYNWASTLDEPLALTN